MKGDGRIFKLKKRGRDGELHELPYWHIGYYGPSKKGDGKIVEYRESSHSENRRVAENLLRDRRNAVANHRAGIRRFVPRQDRILVRELTVGEGGTVKNPTGGLLSNYETRGLASLGQARANVRHLNGILGDDFALAVNRSRIDRYIAIRRREGVCDTTIDKELEKLGQAYSLAIEDQRIAYKPPIQKLVKMHANARQGFVEFATFNAILEHVPDPDIRDFLAWSCFTGMRPKETQSLTWESFDRETWKIRLAAKDAKTGRGRGLPLRERDPETGELRPNMWGEVIVRRIASRRLHCPWIFHGDGEKVVRRTARAFKKACLAAGIPWGRKTPGGLTPYDLRRTAVRNLVRAGVPESVAMKISGHLTRSTFDRYDITSDADVAAAGESVTAYRAANQGTPAAADVKEFKA